MHITDRLYNKKWGDFLYKHLTYYMCFGIMELNKNTDKNIGHNLKGTFSYE